MDGAKPGHTVRFQGLQGAAHLNGTEGTLIKYLKNENRWSVRCDSGDGSTVVKAKPDNLILHRNYRPKEEKMHMASMGFGGGGGINVKHGKMDEAHANDFSSWAKLAKNTKEQYEWFCNCYQMRCDDDYVWGGCNLHGPYEPDATPESIRSDFFIFCILAHQAKAVPKDWDWAAFLKVAPEYIVFAFEKSDAKERWGDENFFNAQMGGRSLRYTARQIYKSDVNVVGDSREYDMAAKMARQKKREWEEMLGGISAWKTLLQDLRKSKRFA